MSLTVSTVGPYFSSGSISFSQLRSNFKETSSGSISASQLLRNTNVLDTNPIVPDATENADIAYSKTPSITGTTVTVSGQSYSVGGTSYPVQGKLWVPTNLIDNPIDLVVAYHGTITLDTSPGATTILDASNTNLTLLKGNEIGIDDKIIFSVAYPQDGITVAQNINVLTQAQLSTFEFGDNLPYARAALLWAKNNLNSYLSSIGLSQRTNNVYMFGHSQGGSLVHKLNTLETTDGAVVNAPGPIRLDVTCYNQENLGLVGPGKTLNPTNVTCQKLFNAYGSAASASEYQDVSLLYDYVTGHKATITYLQALDDPTGGTSGVGQVYWMGELTAAMSANGQSYNYITVPTGGHDAFYKPQNTTLHRAIRGVVGGYGVNLSISQFRDSIKYYNLNQGSGDTDLNLNIANSSLWNGNLNRNIVKTVTLAGTSGSTDGSAAASLDAAAIYNVLLVITGSILGSGGSAGTKGDKLQLTGSVIANAGNGGNGGDALYIDTNGTGTVTVRTSGGSAQVYGGGGGGGGGGWGGNGADGSYTEYEQTEESTGQAGTYTDEGGKSYDEMCKSACKRAYGENASWANECYKEKFSEYGQDCGGNPSYWGDAVCYSNTGAGHVEVTSCKLVVTTETTIPSYGGHGGDGSAGGVGQGYSQSKTNAVRAPIKGELGGPTARSHSSAGVAGRGGDGGNGQDWGQSGNNGSNGYPGTVGGGSIAINEPGGDGGSGGSAGAAVAGSGYAIDSSGVDSAYKGSK